ncbi:hypothetical protein D3C85_1723730 [compost metagenome]
MQVTVSGVPRCSSWRPSLKLWTNAFDAAYSAMFGTDWYAPGDAMFTMCAGPVLVLCASTKHRASATSEVMLS